MTKALPIVGITGAVFAALSIAVFVQDSGAIFLPLLVCIAGSVVLLGQRSVHGTIAGLVILFVTVIASLGLVGFVSTKGGGGMDLGVSPAVGHVLAIGACLGLTGAAAALRWDDAQPRWLSIGGLACAGLAFILVAINPSGIAQQNEVGTLIAAVLALLSIAAMIPLMRTPGPGQPDAKLAGP